MSHNCDCNEPLRGEKEPSMAALPMVKASQPAAAMSRMRAGESMLPATTSSPWRESRAARINSSGSASTQFGFSPFGFKDGHTKITDSQRYAIRSFGKIPPSECRRQAGGDIATTLNA